MTSSPADIASNPGKPRPLSITAERQFETGFARLIEADEAVSFWKARVALSAILEAAKIGTGDEVIVPGYTCIVVPNAVLYAGARPVYADIEPDTYNLNVAHVEAQITPRTRAIVVQHTYGSPANMAALSATARRHGVLLIEDSAHALGARYRGVQVGSLGDVGFFSFQWSKPFTTGLGGMAVGSGEWGRQLREVRSGYAKPSGREMMMLGTQLLVYRWLFRPRLYWTAMDVLHALSNLGLFVGSSEGSELESEEPARYKKRLSPVQAREGVAQLSKAAAAISHRRQVAAVYERGLGELGLRGPRVAEGAEPVFLRYPLLVRDKGRVLAEARARRIELGSWFESPVHPEAVSAGVGGYLPGTCPVGEAAASRVVNLPTHPKVSRAEADRILEFVADMKRAGHIDL